MKRVIFKAKIEDREKVEARLEEAGVELSPIYWLHDRVYTPRGYIRGRNFPRLVMRTEMHAVDEPPVYFLILRRHIEDSGVDIVQRTAVFNYVAAVEMILQLGFTPAGEVSRRRQQARYKGAFVCIDEIDGQLKSFLKVEAEVSKGEKVGEIREELLKVLDELTRDLREEETVTGVKTEMAEAGAEAVEAGAGRNGEIVETAYFEM